MEAAVKGLVDVFTGSFYSLHGVSQRPCETVHWGSNYTVCVMM